MSLPKNWVERWEIRKGDVVLLEEAKDGTLRVLASKGQQEPHHADVEYIVNADLCDEPGMLGRIVVGNYVIGRNVIRIRSKGRIKSHHIQEVRASANKLMGMGILQETADEIELQCSVDPARFPIESVMKRLYTIGSTIHKEAIESLVRNDAELAKDAAKREDEADMMYWLTLRLLLSAQMDPVLAEKVGFTETLPILGNRLISKNLETIADYGESIAHNVLHLLDQRKRPEEPLVHRFKVVSDSAAKVVADGLAGVFTRDVKLVNRAIELANQVEKDVDNLVQDCYDKVEDPIALADLRAIAWSLRRIAEFGSEIAIIGFNRYLERSSAICEPLSEKESGKR
ncbi:MAG TPA: PhoU domain-containing protein [Candidatus Thermoplasmatota archaeon]|nr:PhoU domain-containing protein [Candidatus Thermoplasmatota archaeon]